jgi:MFS family permease
MNTQIGGSPPTRRAPTDSPTGWLVVAATFISTATVFGITYSFTAFLAAMADDLDTGNGSTALLFGLTIFFLFVLGLPAGRASDLWGPRPVVAVGCVAMVAGLVLTSLVEEIWLGYLTYGGGIGIGAACCYVPMVSQVSGWFERQRALAVGVAVSGIGIGTLIGPPLTTALIEAHGWRTTYRLCAVAALVGLTVAATLVRPAPAAAGAAPLDLRATFASPVFRSLYVSGLMMTLALFVPFVFLKPYAEEHGISPAAAATLISFLGIGSLGGRLVLGAFVNRVGLLRLYQACFAVLGASFLIWLGGGSSYVALAVFAFVLGTSYGGYVALSPAAAAELFGLSGLGAVLGALYTAGGIGGLIGPPAAGWLIDTTDDYTASIVLALVLGLISVVVLRTAINAVDAEQDSARTSPSGAVDR